MRIISKNDYIQYDGSNAEQVAYFIEKDNFFVDAETEEFRVAGKNFYIPKFYFITKLDGVVTIQSKQVFKKLFLKMEELEKRNDVFILDKEEAEFILEFRKEEKEFTEKLEEFVNATKKIEFIFEELEAFADCVQYRKRFLESVNNDFYNHIAEILGECEL